MIDRYRKKIAAMVIQLAQEDPELVLEVIGNLRDAGEIECDDLKHLEKSLEAGSRFLRTTRNGD